MADEEVNTDRFFLEKLHITADDDSEYQYEEIPIEEEWVRDEIEEDLDKAVRTLTEATQDALATEKKEDIPKAEVSYRPEVVDDFVRNFLVKMGMDRTLDCFQTEWYEKQQRDLLKQEDIGIVPDIYCKNQQLEHESRRITIELNKFKGAAMKAKENYVKLRKERDYHRMHHKRVVQEKNKLINDLKRLKNHYASYEPTLRQLKQKYETAMKEKMLTKLQRDRAVGQVQGLQSTIKNIDGNRSGRSSIASKAVLQEDAQGLGPTQRNLKLQRENVRAYDVREETGPRYPNDSIFPPDMGVNPMLSHMKGPPGHLTRTGGFRLSNTFTAHSHAVSSLSLHPRKQILVTTSDDHLWKMWSVPSGENIMTGDGHTDWVSDCDFHPSGAKLATVSGDTTTKIWDFAKAECVHTFMDHTHAVWGCSFHSCGDFLATCSMDNTSKIWDLNSMRCRFTLRGHTDSVNSIEFLPYSNIIVTCSADKTISLWDAKNALCAQTFYGHMHSINHVTFNSRGDTLASGDSYGIVKLWDVKTCAPMASVDVGPHPVNRVAFDPSGQVLAVASNDGSVKMYEVANGEISSLAGHEDAVQCVLFDKSGEFMVSGGSDHTVRIWS